MATFPQIKDPCPLWSCLTNQIETLTDEEYSALCQRAKSADLEEEGRVLRLCFCRDTNPPTPPTAIQQNAMRRHMTVAVILQVRGERAEGAEVEK